MKIPDEVWNRAVGAYSSHFGPPRQGPLQETAFASMRDVLEAPGVFEVPEDDEFILAVRNQAMWYKHVQGRDSRDHPTGPECRLVIRAINDLREVPE